MSRTSLQQQSSDMHLLLKRRPSNGALLKDRRVAAKTAVMIDNRVVTRRTRKATTRLSFLVGAEFGQHAEIFQRGGVAFDIATGGNFLQQTAHDLSAAGFW